ncbi:MAG: DUF3990 domain-containing protein [Treponema sp.]|jgi:hypothetical protein|nr:DUF3990 domain-containing protein [Treponema sp.]
MILYHGGTDIIEKPAIKPQPGGRDFGTGFYCTDIRSQAEKWAKRQGRVRKQPAILNIYEFDDQVKRHLNCMIFNDYSKEWLELVINCRKNPDYTHGFDIVHGKIANDDVGETVQAVVDGLMPFDFALQKLVFMPSNNQYCFCTEKSLENLGFIESLKPD